MHSRSSGGSCEEVLQYWSSLPTLILMNQHLTSDSFNCGNISGRPVVDLAPVGGVTKRSLDIGAASIALFLLLPLIVIVAIVVRVGVGAPVFYRHRRVGLHGREFDCLKFRTMVADGDQVLQRHLAENPEAAREWKETRKLRNDPRVGPVGRFLRKASLDELPQLINVLRGDMSCVGPRPVVPEELAQYRCHVRHYLSGRPGITGIWQISGRSSTSYRTRVILDTLYVRRWSFARDIRILLLTVPAVFRTRDAG